MRSVKAAIGIAAAVMVFTSCIDAADPSAPWRPEPAPADAPIEAARVRIVDFGHDFLRDGDGRPAHQFHVHRLTYVKDEATGLHRPDHRPTRAHDHDVDGDGRTDDDAVAYHAFSLDRPLSPTAPFYDRRAGSARFYGAAVLFRANAPEALFTEDGVNHEHDGPRHYPRDNWALFHERYALYSPDRVAGLWLWKKEDFLNRGADHRVSFDETSTLALYLQRYWMGIEGGRWVVRDDEGYWISEAVFEGAGQQRGSGNGKQHVLHPTQTKWAEYKPKAPYDITFDGAKATFRERRFDDVRAVGWLVYKNELISSYFGFKWYAFEAEAVVHRPKRPSEHIAMRAVKTSDGVPAFHISKAVVPYELWKDVYRRARSNTFVRDPRGYTFDTDGDMGDMDTADGPVSLNAPVTDVTAMDVAAWCNALSELESRTPCYYEDEARTIVFRQVLRSPQYVDQSRPDELFVKWDADGYRLPTVGEQQAAGRDGGEGFAIVRRDAGAAAPREADPVPIKPSRPAPTPRQAPKLDLVPVPGTRIAAAKHEVSFDVWRQVHAWAVANGYAFDHDGDMGSMDFWGCEGWPEVQEHRPSEPVTDITQYDAWVWCNALSRWQGLTPVYYADEACTREYKRALRYRPLMMLFFEAWEAFEAGQIKYLDVDRVYDRVHVKDDADGYRLPTQKEFEAMRTPAGQRRTRHTWGHNPADVFGNAWLFDTSGGTTHPVGTARPNALGLYDVEGNVAEMVDDAGKPWGVTRCGGSFIDLTLGLQHHKPPFSPAGWGYPDLGFRVVKQTPGDERRSARPDRGGPSLPAVLTAMTLAANATEADAQIDLLQGRVYRGNLHRTGHFDVPGTARLGGLRWKFKTGGPVRSSPVVVDGVVYIGSHDGHIYAIDAERGQLRWKHETQGPVAGSAAVVDGVVYIASEDGRLYALDARSGEEKWVTVLTNRDRPAGSPAIVGDVVHMPTGSHGGSDELMMTARPLVALDAATGQKKLTLGVSPQGFAAPAIAEGLIFAGVNGSSFGAADLATGRSRWSHATGHQDRQFVNMVCSGGRVYAAGSMAGSITALEAATGKRLWQQHTWPEQVAMNNSGQWGHEVLAAPAIAHDRVYVPCDDGRLHTFDAKTGARGWTFDAGAKIRSAPSVAGGAVYFGGYDGRLHALNARTGAPLWQQALGGPIASSPWPTAETIYVGCDDGHVYAIEAE